MGGPKFSIFSIFGINHPPPPPIINDPSLSIAKILLFSQNYSKVLHWSVPDLLFPLDVPGTAHTGLPQSGVIFEPGYEPNYSGVM